MAYSSIEEIQRDLNPTPEARLAMIMFGEEYSQQSRGSMGFWDSLSETRQHDVKRALAKIAEAAQIHSISLDQMNSL